MSARLGCLLLLVVLLCSASCGGGGNCCGGPGEGGGTGGSSSGEEEDRSGYRVYVKGNEVILDGNSMSPAEAVKQVVENQETQIVVVCEEAARVAPVKLLVEKAEEAGIGVDLSGCE